MTHAGAVLGCVLLLGCTIRAGFDVDTDGGAVTTTMDGAGGTFGDAEPEPPDGGFPPVPPPTSGTSGGDDEGVGFIPPGPDTGAALRCNIFEQDCPPGDKCMPYSSDGGAWWNATKCTPIARDPSAYGEACQVEGRGASGVDDCDLGMLCWNVDREGVGRCVHLCKGPADNPTCPQRDESCNLSRSGPPLCIASCDPLAQDCFVENEVCYPVGEDWVCVPDASGDAGAFGDPCEYTNACDAFHVCIGPRAFTACGGAVGCCSPVCNARDDTADAACNALDSGLSCELWYLEGQAPPGYEHVGVCAVPR